MDKEVYLETQAEIIRLVREIEGLPLVEFISAGEKADTIGPFVDPTLWRKATDRLGVLLDIARPLKQVQDKVKEHNDELLELDGSTYYLRYAEKIEREGRGAHD